LYLSTTYAVMVLLILNDEYLYILLAFIFEPVVPLLCIYRYILTLQVARSITSTIKTRKVPASTKSIIISCNVAYLPYCIATCM
jgi:hypothetical protein